MKFIAALAAVFVLAGCQTLRSDYDRIADVEAQLPRGQGLGAFAGSCLFFCWVRAEFTQGDVAPPEVLIDDGKIKANIGTSHRLNTEQSNLKKGKPKGVQP